MRLWTVMIIIIVLVALRNSGYGSGTDFILSLRPSG